MTSHCSRKDPSFHERTLVCSLEKVSFMNVYSSVRVSRQKHIEGHRPCAMSFSQMAKRDRDGDDEMADVTADPDAEAKLIEGFSPRARAVTRTPLENALRDPTW